MPYNVPWIYKSSPDHKNIKRLLTKTNETQQYTNGGPLVSELEKKFREIFKIDDNMEIIACCNATVGLHALVGALKDYYKKELKFATEAFTFPSVAQGTLKNIRLCDVGEINKVIDEVDGAIITNLFGHYNRNHEVENNKDKIIIYDNATAPYTFYEGKNILNFGDASVVSLHHTKPIGFGEGGIIVVKKQYKDCVRRNINFGFNYSANSLRWSGNATNAKMSDINAAFILDYWSKLNIADICDKYKSFISKLDERLVFPTNSDVMLPSCIPILFDKNITNDVIVELGLKGIVVRKYYKPLKERPYFPYANELYDKILCLPFHIGVDDDVMNRYLEIIRELDV